MRCIFTGVLFIIWSVWFGSAIINELGRCRCGVFNAEVPDVALIDHALPLNVTCDIEGSQRCLDLCSSLAEITKDRAMALICENLQTHVENVKVSLYSKACTTGDWKFTGIRQKYAICCDAGKEFKCEFK